MSKQKKQNDQSKSQGGAGFPLRLAVATVTLGMGMGVSPSDVLAAPQQLEQENQQIAAAYIKHDGAQKSGVKQKKYQEMKGRRGDVKEGVVQKPGVKQVKPVPAAAFPKVEQPATQQHKR